MKRLLMLVVLLMASASTQAAISFVVASTSPALQASPTQDGLVNRPAGMAVGDLMLVQLSLVGGSSVNISTVPTGWTLVVRTDRGTTLTQLVYKKIVTSTDLLADEYIWRPQTEALVAIAMVVFRGVDTTTPVEASAGQASTSSSSITAPAVTTLGASREVVRFYASAAGGQTIGVPGSITQRFATRSTGNLASGVAIIAGSTSQVAGGSTGATVATSTSAAANIGTTVALKPAGSLATTFKLAYASTGIYCIDQTVSISTTDGAGNAAVGYNGTVNLSSSTAKGTWLLSSGAGTLTDAVADDGAATYAWNASQSSATFLFRYRTGPAVVTLDAADSVSPSIADDSTQGAMTFSPDGFTVTSSALSNPPPGSIPAFSSPQIAGSNVSVYVTAYGQTPTDPTCGVIEGYTGAKSLKFWSTYADPATGTLQVAIDSTTIATSEGASASQSVTFSSGQAVVTARYRDAGSLAISMKDDTTGNPGLPTGIRGTTGNIVSRPADFVVSNIKRTADNVANPAASTAGGSVFIGAGRPFTATITAVDSSGSATPNFGRESSPETVKFSVSLVLPSSGNAPVVSGTTGSFTNGVATGTAFAWPEVGIVKLVPRVSDGNYLGAGDVVGSMTGNVGRFIPDNFTVTLNTPVFGTGCAAGSYTYVGQSFTYTVAPVITATARAYGGTTTQNYTGSLFRLTNGSLTGRSYAAVTGTLVTSGLPSTSADPVIADAGGGVATLTYSAGSGIAFDRSTPAAPFNASISLAQNVIDLDSASASNPVTFGLGSGIAFSTSATQRYGRLILRNAVGSELLDLPVSLSTQYYVSAGVGFAPNSSDSCTTAPPISLSGFQAALAAGETCVRDTGSPGVSAAGCAAPAAAGSRYRATPLAGAFNLNLAAPGGGNSGATVITATAPTWLQFDWNASTSGNENPTALASFGLFPGPSSRIFQREVF